MRAAQAPRDPDGFVAWFEGLKETGPGQGDPLFPWLADASPRPAMLWFLTQEVAGEAGSTIWWRSPRWACRSSPSSNWPAIIRDETGRGNVLGMHGGMLRALAHALEIEPTLENSVAESLELAGTPWPGWR